MVFVLLTVGMLLQDRSQTEQPIRIAPGEALQSKVAV